MLSKIVKKKELAFQYGTNMINTLQEIILEQHKNYNLKVFDNNNINYRFVGFNVIDITKMIYNNMYFYEYLKYSFIGKYYEKKIYLFKSLLVLLFALLGFGLYLIFGLGIILYILGFILITLLIIILVFFMKSGESYSSYYNRTMLTFLLNIYGNINVSLNSSNNISDVEIHNIISKDYNKKNVKNNFIFSGLSCNGKIADLDLLREKEIRKKDGTTKKRSYKVFDGFYLSINTTEKFNMFRGNSIKISNDENMFSAITEDTVNGIYESSNQISFNSEEMTKAFDGRISGYIGFDSVDDMHIQAQKILTPSFEQHLLYLRSRYNTFNMNISDNGLTFAVDMNRSLYQQSKHDELFDFSTSYREANEDFRMLKPDLNGIEDFAYYNVFPFLERIYLINYLTYLYLSYMDFEHYYNINNDSINSFEVQMQNIYTMKNKDFRELYTDKLKQIKDDAKESVIRFEKEEKLNG